MTDPTNWAEFLGRFHPVLVHAPIGVLLALAVTEAVLIASRRQGDLIRSWLTLVSAGAAIAAVVAGWLLAEGGGYEVETLAWHRWLGVTLAVLCLGLVLVDRLVRSPLWYRVLLASCLLLVPLVGHLGGNLTHGPNYLFQHAPQWLRPAPVTVTATAMATPTPTPPTNRVSFTRDVAPILNEHCIECHGSTKRKGGLSLVSLAMVLAGGKEGPVVVAGQPDASTLVTATERPADHPDLMPEGGPPLSASQTTILRAWVAAGLME